MTDLVKRLRKEAFRDDEVLIDTMSVICEAADEIERLREIIAMTDNRLEAAMLDGGVCEHCVEVARSYLQEAAALTSPHRAENNEQERQ